MLLVVRDFYNSENRVSMELPTQFSLTSLEMTIEHSLILGRLLNGGKNRQTLVVLGQAQLDECVKMFNRVIRDVTAYHK